jgi:serine/threonine-protein kinase
MKRTRKPLKFFLSLLVIITVILLLFGLINILMPILVMKGREITMPNLIGMNKDDALLTINRFGLRTGEIRSVPNPEIPANRVVAHFPRAGRRVKPGRKVDLDISAGTGKVRIPSLDGLPLSSALTTLERLGFVVARIDSIRSATVPQGRVVAVSPPPGAEVRPGSEVIISVSTKTGTFPMPNLVGLNIETARGIIVSNGLFPGKVKPAVSTEPFGTVIFQYPEEGMTVAPGDTVSLIIASPTDSIRP